MKKPLTMLLAGGGGTRLGVLVKARAKPAVPFGGRYRIIDYALSNVMHAGLDQVGVLTQYKPLSLMRHLGVGGPWNLRGRRRGVRILPPRTGEEASDWYRGTADAIWQNMDFMRSASPERVLILSGDHIYRMDYQRMVKQHIDRRADLSIAVMPVAPEDASRFGMLWTDSQGVITRFEEKPPSADTDLASMGIYLFEWECLVEALERIVATRQGFDFGFDIMSRLLDTKRVVAHRFDGYWRDVGTIDSYFSANMDTLAAGSGLDLDGWEICTRDETNPEGDRSPAWFGRSASCRSVLVSAGCVVEGTLSRSILGPDVKVASGATVEDSILMDGVVVGPNAVVRNGVVDKNVRIGAKAVLDGGRNEIPNPDFDRCQLGGRIVIGKGSVLPDGIRIGSNVVIDADRDEGSFSDDLPDGATVVCSP